MKALYKRPSFEVKLLTIREVPTVLLDEPEKVAQYWNEEITQSSWFTPEREMFVVVHMNTRRHTNGFELISMGTLDATVCHARDIFRKAILANDACIVLMHNHPSGDPTPSEADVRITRDLIRAGQALKIDVMDHIIMGTQPMHERGFTSLRESGYFAGY